jgi:Protein of unknown function (DUF3703)
MTTLRQKTAVKNLLSHFEQQRYSVYSPDTGYEKLFDLLCAAHIAGQFEIALHIQTHRAMLSLAWQHNQWAEVVGQLLRIALIPPGHLLRRLPMGNSGRANISAFKSMAPPQHLLRLIDEAAIQVSDDTKPLF